MASPTWLCPTEFHRVRLLQMERDLAGARLLMYASLGIGLAVLIPWIDAWPALLLVIPFGYYAVVRRGLETSSRPEYVIMSTIVVANLTIACGVALSGGPQSPAVILFLLPVITLPARFGRAGVVVGLVMSLGCLVASTAGADPGGFAEQPSHVVATFAALVGLAAFADGLMRAEVTQRTHAVVDELTGIPNRMAFAARVAELRSADLGDSMLAVAVFDLDRFKTVNDTHGHGRGDEVLRAAAAVLRDTVRVTDAVYRIGGEEFVVFMPGASREVALRAAERVRVAMERARPGGLDVTTSVGVACGAEAYDVDSLLAAADSALYAAKSAGRNRVVAAAGHE